MERLTPSRRVSLNQIAKAAGVSRSTVSRALHNDPQISPPQRDKLRILAEQMGYQPDPAIAHLAAARWGTLAPRSGYNLAYLTQSSANPPNLPFRWNCYLGASEEAQRLGNHLEYFNLREYKSARQLQRVLTARNIRGAILGYNEPSPVLLGLDFSDLAVVSCGPQLEGIPLFHGVTTSAFWQVLTAIKQVCSYGYRRIGIAWIRHFNFYEEDLLRAGAIRSLQESLAGSEVAVEAVHNYQSPGFEEAAETVGGLLETFQPEALIGFTGLYYHALTTGLKKVVPDDLAFANLHIMPQEHDFAGIINADYDQGLEAMRFLDVLLRTRQTGLPQYPIAHTIHHRWKDGLTMPRRGPPAAIGCHPRPLRYDLAGRIVPPAQMVVN